MLDNLMLIISTPIAVVFALIGICFGYRICKSVFLLIIYSGFGLLTITTLVWFLWLGLEL